MRSLLALIFVLPLQVLAMQVFHLEKLMESAERHRAPADLRKHLAADPENRAALIRCKAEKRWNLDEIEEFFASIPLSLSVEKNSFLVFPAKHCPEFFGAHSIPYWIVERQVDGTYRELFWGTDDVVKVLDTRTKGYRDIAAQYGSDPPKSVRFTGTKYAD